MGYDEGLAHKHPCNRLLAKYEFHIFCNSKNIISYNDNQVKEKNKRSGEENEAMETIKPFDITEILHQQNCCCSITTTATVATTTFTGNVIDTLYCLFQISFQ
jgi:hypothetical protein